MKRLITILLTLLTVFTAYSIVQGDNIEAEVKITITADEKTTFDMFYNSKVTKELTTPYEVKFKQSDARFIFKSVKSESSLKIKVEKDNQTRLTAEWPIAVLLITEDTFTIFGM